MGSICKEDDGKEMLMTTYEDAYEDLLLSFSL